MLACRTKETLAGGNFYSVINVLMQLRKVCNHPNLFEPRPITSPFRMSSGELDYYVPSIVVDALAYDPHRHVNLYTLNALLVRLLTDGLSSYAAHQARKYTVYPQLIEEVDHISDPPPRVPRGKVKLTIATSPEIVAQARDYARSHASQRSIPQSPRACHPSSFSCSPPSATNNTFIPMRRAAHKSIQSRPGELKMF